jgi:hypothetical protein
MLRHLMIAALALGCQAPEKKTIVETRWKPIPTELPQAPPDPLPPVDPKFLDFDNFEQEIIDDLNAIVEPERIFTRYIWNPRFNEGLDATQNSQIRDGVNLGINSISSEKDITTVHQVGRSGNIFRIDMRDYNLTREEWTLIEESLDLPVQSQTIRGQTIQFLAQARVAWVYAGDFFNTAFTKTVNTSIGPLGLYYLLVDQPGADDINKFFAGIGVNPAAEFRDLEAKCVGFTRAKIALQKNRLICSFDTTDGNVYSTYDTDAGGDNLFENPFPVEANLAKTFKNDAQEHIYSLPNGLFGYRLNGAAAKKRAENEAPITVVIDTEASGIGLDPTIRLLSCSRCHIEIVNAPDQIGPHIQSSTGFNAKAKLDALNIFRQDAFQAAVRRDSARFKAALAEMSIAPSRDPLNWAVTDPHRLEQDVTQIAALFFLEPGEFALRLRAAPDASVQVGSLLNDGGTIGLDQLATSFNVVINDLNLFKDRDQQ